MKNRLNIWLKSYIVFSLLVLSNELNATCTNIGGNTFPAWDSNLTSATEGFPLQADCTSFENSCTYTTNPNGNYWTNNNSYNNYFDSNYTADPSFANAQEACLIDPNATTPPPSGIGSSVDINTTSPYILTFDNFNFLHAIAFPDTVTLVDKNTSNGDGNLSMNGTEITSFDGTVDVLNALYNTPSTLTFVPQSGTSYRFDFNVSSSLENNSSIATVIINYTDPALTPSNTPPTASNVVFNINEDTNKTFTANDFNFSDSDAGDTLSSISITTLENAGYMKLNGTDVTLNQQIAVADIANLVFAPLSNANGSPYTTFGFKVNDGTSNSTNAYTATINVIPVNDAPTDITLDSYSIPENSIKSLTLSATDVDSGDMHVFFPCDSNISEFFSNNFNASLNAGDFNLSVNGDKELLTNNIKFDYETSKTQTMCIATVDLHNGWKLAGGSLSKMVTLNITNVAEKPMIHSSTMTKKILINEPYLYALYATDPDGGGVRWSVADSSKLPSGIRLTSELNSSSPKDTVAKNLKAPAGFTFDTNGNIYVIDEGNSTINKITPEGQISQFAKGFTSPRDIVFNSTDRIFYVSNYGTGTISKVALDGNVSSFVSGLDKPVTLALDENKTLYVTEYGSGTVKKITPQGYVSTFVSGLTHPYGLAFDKDGRLYVSELSEGTVQKIALNGASFTNFTTALSSPAEIAFDADNTLYVTEFSSGKIQKITADKTKTEFAQGLKKPRAIGLDKSGNLYLSELGANELNRFFAASLSGKTTQVGKYNITLEAKDDTNLTTEQNITIEVIAPPTTIDLNTTTVAENNAKDVALVSISSKDPDQTGGHTYQFCDGFSSSDFGIGQDGKTLIAKKAFDYESDAHSYTLCLRAYDDDQLTLDANVTIALTNVDESPKITTNTPSEAIVVGSTYKYEMAATDPEGSAITWSAEGKLPSGIGLVDMQNGQKVALHQFDADPFGITFDAQNNLYVAIPEKGEILKITPDKQKSILVNGLDGVLEIAVDNQGFMYATQSVKKTFEQRLVKINLKTKTITPFATDAGITKPLGVAYGKDGYIYVSDASDKSVVKLASDGSVANASLVVTKEVVLALAFDNSGKLYITQNGTKEALKVSFDKDGNVVQKETLPSFPEGITAEKASSRIYGLAFDMSGRVLLNLGENKSIYTYTGSKVLQGEADKVGDYSFLLIAKDSSGNEEKQKVTIKVTPAKPTDIILSNRDIKETLTVASTVGTFTTEDPSKHDTHTYSFCETDNDNNYFAVVDDTLITAKKLDYESKKTLNICIRTTDLENNTLDKNLTINVLDVDEAPEVLSTPVTTAITGKNYQYVLKAKDPEGKKVTWSVKKGTKLPKGITLTNPDSQGSSITTVTDAVLNSLVVDNSGNIYAVDGYQLRKVDASGKITTIAGSEKDRGFGGDGSAATSALLNTPSGVTVDNSGNIYIADSMNNRIRKVDTHGIITTVAGSGKDGGFGGDGSAATSALMNFPTGIAVDTSGNLYIADSINFRIRKVDTHGIITTVAGSSRNGGFGGDGGAATSALLSYPLDVAVDTSGNLYIADNLNDRVRKVDISGKITTIYKNVSDRFKQVLGSVDGVAVDSKGNLYIADSTDHEIKKVTFPPMLSGTPPDWNSDGEYFITLVASDGVHETEHSFYLSINSQFAGNEFSVDGTSCDDGDPNTLNDVYTGLKCKGTAFALKNGKPKTTTDSNTGEEKEEFTYTTTTGSDSIKRSVNTPVGVDKTTDSGGNHTYKQSGVGIESSVKVTPTGAMSISVSSEKTDGSAKTAFSNISVDGVKDVKVTMKDDGGLSLSVNDKVNIDVTKGNVQITTKDANGKETKFDLGDVDAKNIKVKKISDRVVITAGTKVIHTISAKAPARVSRVSSKAVYSTDVSIDFNENGEVTINKVLDYDADGKALDDNTPFVEGTVINAGNKTRVVEGVLKIENISNSILEFK